MSEKTLSDLSDVTRDHSEIIKSGRSTIIRKLRIAFPIIAACLLFSVLVFSDRKDPIKATPIEEVIPQKVGENELINPKFDAQDEQNRPFSITSDRAYQNEEDSDDIQLEKPVAQMKLDDGTKISLQGKRGVYQQEDQLLHLEGDVRFTHNDGYDLNTTKVDININEQTATSDEHVTGHGPAGDVEASGLRTNGKTGVFIFKGPATLILKDDKTTEEETISP